MPFRNKDLTQDLDLLEELEQQMNNGQILPSQSTNSSTDFDAEKISTKSLISPINSRLSPMFNPLGNVGKSQSTKGMSWLIFISFG